MARPRYQNGWITEHGKQLYGNFWRYVADPVTGQRKRQQASIPLGEIGKLKKWEAREKLKGFIAEQLGPLQAAERPDPKTTFEWFVQHRYLPVREGRWHKATKDKTTYEINRYLVNTSGIVHLRRWRLSNCRSTSTSWLKTSRIRLSVIHSAT